MKYAFKRGCRATSGMSYRKYVDFLDTLHDAHLKARHRFYYERNKRYRDERAARQQAEWDANWCIHTIAECKRELMRHHPDRGGDPEQAILWTERLNLARRLNREKL